jgi:type IV secretory pathway TraG/TraD family ATPase VirD4
MKPVKDIITTMGETHGRPPHRLFGIDIPDRLHHIAMFGQTGTGKSTLLAQLMRQDISNDVGFCLIDPHGDLAVSIADFAGDKAIYWDVADPACQYGYNPLTHVSEQYRPLVASGLIDALKKQWADAWGARMEHMLRFALLALLSRPSSTIADIVPMFLDKDFRRQILSTVADPQVRQFWELEYKAMNLKAAVDGVAPIANKLGAFLAHPMVRKAVCTPEKPLRFRRLTDEGQILIVNLSKGRLGTDTTNVLGGLIVSSLAQAALSRASVPEEQRKPHFLYLDEFQSFTSAAIADMLSELRKYRLGLTLATQYSSRLDETVRAAILGNVGTLLSFRLGALDAAAVSKQFGANVPTPADLTNLPNFEMITKLMINGSQSKPFSVRMIRADNQVQKSIG